MRFLAVSAFEQLTCLALGISVLTSCDSDSPQEYLYSETIQLEVASSKADLYPQPSAYWLREKGTYTWNLYKDEIEGFSYEPGSEYTITVEKHGKGYNLISINQKVNKQSVVPRFFTNNRRPKEDENWDFSKRRRYINSSKDSMYIFQGDILLAKEQYEAIMGEFTRSLIMYNHPSTNYWSNKKVYYVFSPDFTHQAKVLSAMQKWEEKTLLKFIQGTGNGNYIRFINDDSDPSILGYSSIGCIGGMQVLALGNSSTVGTAIHEIGHALGLHHEHCRNDRDNYITIQWENIPNSQWSQFEIKPYSLDVGSFDFASVMLYSSWQGGSPSMKTVDGYTFGCQREYISDGDSAGIASIPTYGPPLCELTCETVESYYDVSGSVEERNWEDTYTIELYADRYRQVPYTLTTPKTVTMVTVHEYWNPSTNSLVTDRTPWSFVIPAGVSSYTFDTIENRIYYFNSYPGYGYDVKTYELIDQ